MVLTRAMKAKLQVHSKGDAKSDDEMDAKIEAKIEAKIDDEMDNEMDDEIDEELFLKLEVANANDIKPVDNMSNNLSLNYELYFKWFTLLILILSIIMNC